jgi:hypothetical protein
MNGEPMKNIKGSLVMSVALLALVGCGGPPQPASVPASTPPAPPPPPRPAATADFQNLLDASVAELQVKNEANKAWGMGSFDQWDVDQEVGDLVFSNDDGTTATAPAQIIGSFSTNDNTWLWAWDNPSILDGMKRDARKVKQYGEEHKIEQLTTRKWTGTEQDAWAMAALAVKLCGAQGAYRGPGENSYVFMTFGEVKVSKPTQGSN